MKGGSLEEQILQTFLQRVESNQNISSQAAEVLETNASQASFGDEEEIVETLIEQYRE